VIEVRDQCFGYMRWDVAGNRFHLLSTIAESA
jgi:hypothetical protein